MPILLWLKLLAIGIPLAILTLQVLSWRNEAHKVPGLESALSECNAGKLVTLEANNALQRDKDIINSKLISAKRLRSTCLRVTSATDLTYGGHKYARQDGGGISSDWLNEYAAECESYRSQRIRLEEFIVEERR